MFKHIAKPWLATQQAQSGVCGGSKKGPGPEFGSLKCSLEAGISPSYSILSHLFLLKSAVLCWKRRSVGHPWAIHPQFEMETEPRNPRFSKDLLNLRKIQEPQTSTG
jgi:hypothetical protein